MRIYLLALVFLLAAVFIQQSEAGWFRRVARKVWNWGKKQICKKPCGKRCEKVSRNGLVQFACSWACNKYVCKDRRRRSTDNSGVRLLPLPCDFDAWNLDGSKDGCVDLAEFAAMVNEEPDDPNNKQMFEMVDSDGDGCITNTELYTSALHFEKPCEDLGDGPGDVNGDDGEDGGNDDNGGNGGDDGSDGGGDSPLDDGGDNDPDDGGDDNQGDGDNDPDEGGGDDPDDGGDDNPDEDGDSPTDGTVDGGVEVSEDNNSTDISDTPNGN